MKIFAIAALAVITSMTSCNNDDLNSGNSVDGKEKSVYIKMENAPLLTTRSDSESALDKTAVLSTGVVIFVTGDEITRYVNLSTTGTATYTEPTTAEVPTIKISNMMSGEGVEFTNIKADKIYIIGNRTVNELVGLLPVQGSDGKIASGFKMMTLLKSSNSFLDVTDPADMDSGNHSNVALYGQSSLMQILPNENNYKTTIQFVPIVARLEIKEIFASDVTFELSGIFINNYYTTAQVDGTIPTDGVLKNNEDIITNYADAYHATALRDWSITSLGTKTGNAASGVSIKPLDVWGYNIFAAKNVTAEDKNLPHIVLRLKEVKDATGDDITDGAGNVVDKFITVKGFNDGTNPITEFKIGYVYTITKIAFSKADLTDNPEITDRTINATVMVSVRPWIDGGQINPEI